MSIRLFLLTLVLLILVACGGASDRTDDVVPLSDQVATADQATGSGAAFTTEMPDVSLDPDAQAMKFTISGGNVGFCDELIINAAGDYVLNSCNHGQLSGTLEPPDQRALESWVTSLSGFQLYTEDSSEDGDGIRTDLSFGGQGALESDDAQKQVVYDWVSGLVARLQPKPAAEPAVPLAEPVEANGLCPEISRPALILLDFEQPSVLTLLDVASQATCDLTLSYPPFGRIVPAGGNIYFPVTDQEEKSVTVWQIDASGTQKSLDFTTITMDEMSPHGFVVSDDGSKIAWSQTVINFDTEPPTYRNYLWLANTDGSGKVAIIEGVENSEARYVTPIRFSSADNSLFYALQPDIGAPIDRFDTLYQMAADGGEPQLVYACPAEENPLCITGLALNGSVLTVLDPTADALRVLSSDGTEINVIPLPGTDYVERSTFTPEGKLAFMSAQLTEPASEDEPPLPNPAYVTVMAAPYTEPAQTLLSDDSIGTLSGWLDENQLIYGSLNESGEATTVVVNLAVETTPLSSKFAVGVLR